MDADVVYRGRLTALGLDQEPGYQRHGIIPRGTGRGPPGSSWSDFFAGTGRDPSRGGEWPAGPLFARRPAVGYSGSHQVGRPHPERLPYAQRKVVGRVLEYTTGDLSQGDPAQFTPADRSAGHMVIALVTLGHGARAGALDHVRQGPDAQTFQYTGHDGTVALRERMERDPTWPPWIPPRK